jgi:hypothetical protein
MFYMAHTSVDVRTEMADWPGRTGSAPAHAAPFGLHVPGCPTSTLAFPFWVGVKFFPVSNRFLAVAARKLVSQYE